MPPETSAIPTFRSAVRVWLEAHCPAAMRTPLTSDADICWGGRHATFASQAQENWLRVMASRGWTAPTWPTDYGGGGLTAEQSDVLKEELDRIGARPALSSLGLWMLGPALLQFGSETQKREHLPRIARGEIRWCQGYSEPGAGSDLAAVRTRAEDRGDHYLVNGQKVWTSYGDKADWIFCLVRTDPLASKHRGISFLLCDMQSAGISVRPLKLISGASNFTETFFENVEVPKANLVGKENGGWEIAKMLLAHEREMIAALRFAPAEAETAAETAVRKLGLVGGVLSDTFLRCELADIEMNSVALSLTTEYLKAAGEAGVNEPTMSSVLKYVGAELNKRRSRLLVSLGGTDALEWEDAGGNGGTTVRSWLRSYGGAIAGGTSEIQLNIIAKRQLGLPGG